MNIYSASPSRLCSTFSQLSRRTGTALTKRRYESRAFATADNARHQISLCVEGNISSGKSTLLTRVIASTARLKELAHVVPEPVESWQQVARTKKGLQPHNLLGEFYKDPERYAYTFQNYVFMTRFLQERNSSTNEKLLRVMERSVYSDRNVFVESVSEQGWLSELEMDLYNAWLSPMINALPNLVPDGFIYLKADPHVCFNRLQRRARGEEVNVTLKYLESLHDKHETWLMQNVRFVQVADVHRPLQISTVTDDQCNSFTKKPVLILESNEEVDFSNDTDRLEEISLDILAFYEYIQARKMKDSEY